MSLSSGTLSKGRSPCLRYLANSPCHGEWLWRDHCLCTLASLYFLRGSTEAHIYGDELCNSLLEHKTISYLPLGLLRDASISNGKALLSHPGCPAERLLIPHRAFSGTFIPFTWSPSDWIYKWALNWITSRRIPVLSQMLAMYYLGCVKWEFSEVNFSLLPTLGSLLKKVFAGLELLIIHPAFCFFRVWAHKSLFVMT